MSSKHLPDFIENAQSDLEILLPAGIRGELDFDGIQKLCDRFRQRGACTFLITGDAHPFFLNAMQSASAYAACIRRVEDAQKATSEARPFYDAVGCGFWDCAQSIAKSSRTTWNSAKEYEDDFLFVNFLMKHFFLNAGQDECRALIASHEKAAEGADEMHRDICIAFLEKDAPLFDKALRDLLQARAERAEALVKRNAIPEENWSWLRYFSSEGFALLKLAERLEMEVGRDYLHVSESLRESPTFAFDPDAWRHQLRY